MPKVSSDFRPMYVFTVLCVLFVIILLLLRFIVGVSGENDAVIAVLNTAAGTVGAMIGTVVGYEFGGAKSRNQAVRAEDSANANTSTTTEQVTASTTTTTAAPAKEPAAT